MIFSLNLDKQTIRRFGLLLLVFISLSCSSQVERATPLADSISPSNLEEHSETATQSEKDRPENQNKKGVNNKEEQKIESGSQNEKSADIPTSEKAVNEESLNQPLLKPFPSSAGKKTDSNDNSSNNAKTQLSDELSENEFNQIIAELSQSKQPSPKNKSQLHSNREDSPEFDKEKNKVLLQNGHRNLLNGNLEESLNQNFNPIIKNYRSFFTDKKEVFYSPRTEKEKEIFLKKASSTSKKIVLLSSILPEAHYYKAYAQIGMKKLNDAESTLNEALSMSPYNSKYTSELGLIYLMRKNWKQALNIYKRAEKYAQNYSPKSEVKQELIKAMRGVGYSLIEIGELNEAEKKFNSLLRLDSKDKIALNELGYIQEKKQEK